MRSFKKKSDLGNGSHYVTGPNTDGAPQANPDTAKKSGESTDSEDDEDDSNPDGAAIHLDLYKVGGVPRSSIHQPHPATEILRRHQWMNDWHLSSADISFNKAHAHLKHSVHAMEYEELKAHLKTTGILFKGVKSEISKITEQVDGIKNHVDTSIGRLITKTQAATILNNQKDLQKSQQLLQDKMEAMEAKFDLLLSTLLNVDAKKGEKALVTKCGPEIKSTPDDREGGEGGGSGKNKQSAAVTTTLAVQQGTLVTGSSSGSGGSSSCQGQRQHHILMDSTLMLDPETISKRFTQEIEIGERT